MSKIKNILLGTGTVALLSTASASWYYLKFIPAKEASNLAIAYRYLPSKTKLAIYVSTDRSSWQKASNFGSPSSREFISNFIARVRDETIGSATSDASIDSSFSWTGSMTIATVDTTFKSNIILTLGIKDKLAFWRFVSTLNVKQNSNYRGIKIGQISFKKKNWYAAEIENYVVLSQDKPLLKQTIDDFSQNNSLAALPAVKQDLIGDTSPQIFSAYVNSPTPSISSVTVTGKVTDFGFELNQIARSNANKNRVNFTSIPMSWSEIPDNSIAALAGFDLASFFSSNSFQNPVTKELKSIGVDLKGDLVNNITSDYSLVLLPNSSGSSAASLALIFTAADPQKTRQSLAKLDEILRAKGWVVRRTQNGAAWSRDFADAKFAWGSSGSTFYLLAGEANSQKLLLPEKSTPLVQTEAVKSALTSSKSYNGYVFVNPRQFVELLKGWPVGSYISPELREAIAQIDTLIAVFEPLSYGWRTKYTIKLKKTIN